MSTIQFHHCWICFALDRNKDPRVPKANGFAVDCSKCKNWFCGFNHLMCSKVTYIDHYNYKKENRKT